MSKKSISLIINLVVVIFLIIGFLLIKNWLSKKEDVEIIATDQITKSILDKSGLAKVEAKGAESIKAEIKVEDKIESAPKNESIDEKRAKSFSSKRSEDVAYFAKKGAVEVNVIEATTGGLIKAEIVSSGEIIFIDLLEPKTLANPENTTSIYTTYKKDYTKSLILFVRDIQSSKKTIWFREDKIKKPKLVENVNVFIRYGDVYESKGLDSFNSSFMKSQKDLRNTQRIINKAKGNLTSDLE